MNDPLILSLSARDHTSSKLVDQIEGLDLSEFIHCYLITFKSVHYYAKCSSNFLRTYPKRFSQT